MSPLNEAKGLRFELEMVRSALTHDSQPSRSQALAPQTATATFTAVAPLLLSPLADQRLDFLSIKADHDLTVNLQYWCSHISKIHQLLHCQLIGRDVAVDE